jgi:DNA repair protein RecO (recombination protein O)
MQALKYLRHFQRSSYSQAARAQISTPIQAEIEHIMETYFTNILERNLNTPSFIRDVRLKVYLSKK